MRMASRGITGILVQQLHGMTEQDFGVQVGGAVGRNQVVQVDAPAADC